MKIIVYLITALIVSTQIASAQDFDYEVSDPYKVVDAANKQYLYQDGEVMAIKSHGKKFVIIQKWDSESMKEISRTKYEDLPAGFRLESLESFNDHYYMFYSV
jgi:hypothetical protein